MKFFFHRSTALHKSILNTIVKTVFPKTFLTKIGPKKSQQNNERKKKNIARKVKESGRGEKAKGQN